MGGAAEYSREWSDDSYGMCYRSPNINEEEVEDLFLQKDQGELGQCNNYEGIQLSIYRLRAEYLKLCKGKIYQDDER